MDSTIIAAIITATGAIISAFIARSPSPREDNNQPTDHPPIPKAKYVFLIMAFFLAFISFILFRASKPDTEVLPSDTTISTSHNEETATETTDSDKKSPHISIGSIHKLGTYEQDNDKNNGSEEIEWIALDQDGNEVLLISVLGLEPLPYAKGQKESDWKSSSIRLWLNDSFYENSFSEKEKNNIIKKTIHQDINVDYPYCEQGEDTIDSVFLLSAEEFKQYMLQNINIDEEACYGIPSMHAKIMGADMTNNKYCWWWLRTSSMYNATACSVTAYGVLDPRSRDVSSGKGVVRPAMWVDADLLA